MAEPATGKLEPLSRELEEYLEALYVLTDSNKTPAKTTDIAKRLGIAPPSVTEMLQRLDRKNLAKYSKYEGTTLTKKGMEIGRKMVRRHRLLERFLHDILKIGKDHVHEQACQLEHDISEEAEESLCRFLKHPDLCPDEGRIIPPCDLPYSSCEECMQLHGKGLEEVGKRRENLIALSDLKEGQTGKVSFIRGGHNVLQRLLDMGLTPNTKIGVIKAAPFKGPIEISVRSSKLALGRGIASKVFVETENQG